jgi:hypothetical protein
LLSGKISSEWLLTLQSYKGFPVRRLSVLSYCARACKPCGQLSYTTTMQPKLSGFVHEFLGSGKGQNTYKKGAEHTARAEFVHSTTTRTEGTAAHAGYRLPLLPSGPGGVHGPALRGARSSPRLAYHSEQTPPRQMAASKFCAASSFCAAVVDDATSTSPSVQSASMMINIQCRAAIDAYAIGILAIIFTNPIERRGMPIVFCKKAWREFPNRTLKGTLNPPKD